MPFILSPDNDESRDLCDLDHLHSCSDNQLMSEIEKRGLFSKINIPTVGSLIELQKPWSFTLYDESRNDSLAKLLSKHKKAKIPKGKDAQTEVSLPSGTVLEVDRVYIRQNAGEYDSLTFKINGCDWFDDKDKNLRVFSADKCFARFWAKLDDVNKIIGKMTEPKESENTEEKQLSKHKQLLQTMKKCKQSGIVCWKHGVLKSVSYEIHHFDWLSKLPKSWEPHKDFICGLRIKLNKSEDDFEIVPVVGSFNKDLFAKDLKEVKTALKSTPWKLAKSKIKTWHNQKFDGSDIIKCSKGKSCKYYWDENDDSQFGISFILNGEKC